MQQNLKIMSMSTVLAEAEHEITSETSDEIELRNLARYIACREAAAEVTEQAEYCLIHNHRWCGCGDRVFEATCGTW